MKAIALMLGMVIVVQSKDPDVVKISLDLENASLRKVLESVTRESKIPITVDVEVLKNMDLDKEVLSVKVENTTVTNLLRLILEPRKLEARWVEKTTILVTFRRQKK